jgi:DNA-binding LytR/AlgR family response regulator
VRIAICDDDKLELLKIGQFVNEFLNSSFTECKIEVLSFGSSIELISQLESDNNFDLFLLDIIMPGLNGIELASEIRSRDKVAKILFLTSSPEFAVDSYSVGAFNYLLKPVQKDKLFSVLEKANKDICSGMNKFIVVKTQAGMNKIFIHDLIYVEVIGRTIFFHQTNGIVTEGISTLSQVEAVLLPDKRFIKPHRSYIVNLDYVKNLSQESFTTISSMFIPVSRNVFKEVKQAYINYCFQVES